MKELIQEKKICLQLKSIESSIVFKYICDNNDYF